MREINPNMYFVFVSVSTGLLVIFLRPQRITGDHLSQDAPTQFVPMSDSLQSSNVVAALDPRVDLESDVSFEPLESDDGVPDPTPTDADPRQAQADQHAAIVGSEPTASRQRNAEDTGAGSPATVSSASQPTGSARDQNNDRADGQGDTQRIDPR